MPTRPRRQAAEEALKVAAGEAKTLIANSSAASPEHPYLAEKGIQPHHLKQDEKGNLLVPIGNAAGEIRAYQKISAKATKRFAKGAEKLGNFASFGKLEDGKPIIIAEGAATAATLSETSGVPTVAALDCHNLKPVALELRKAYPNAPIIVAADNDHSKARNLGLEKAEAAAGCRGRVIVPGFDKESDKGSSDYNDLARLKGREAVAKDVQAAVRQGAASKEVAAPGKLPQEKSDGR